MVLDTTTNKFRMTRKEYEELKEAMKNDNPYSDDEMELDKPNDRERVKATLRKRCFENAEIID